MQILALSHCLLLFFWFFFMESERISELHSSRCTARLLVNQRGQRCSGASEGDVEIRLPRELSLADCFENEIPGAFADKVSL